MTCVHHYLLSRPDGPTSLGVCKLCGESRVFKNSGPENNSWEGGGAHAGLFAEARQSSAERRTWVLVPRRFE